MQIKKKKNEKAKKESNFNKKNEIPKIKENKPQKTWVKTDETKRNERNDIRNF